MGNDAGERHRRLVRIDTPSHPSGEGEIAGGHHELGAPAGQFLRVELSQHMGQFH